MLFKYNEQNPKLLFLKKLAIVIILIFIFDYIMGSILHKLYFAQTSGLNFRTTYALEETRSDIIVLGSSRANHHYVPQILEDKSGLSCYNAGRDGQHLLFQHAMLKGILKRHTPKIILLDIMPNQLLIKSESYERLDALLPYYNTHEEIRSIIESKSKLEKIKLISRIYPFNSLLLSILKFNFSKQVDNDGYIPLGGNMKISNNLKPKINEEVIQNESFDLNVIKALESIITESKLAKVKLYLIISPGYSQQRYPESMKELCRIADKSSVTLLDYSDNQEFMTNLELFQDFSHLNNTGAALFSKIISEKIQQDLIIRQLKTQ